jgi:RNA polymerase sigma factor (sigma-70 family)
LRWNKQGEILDELYKALESLPPRQKDIIMLSFMDGKKNQEIADQLNISVRTVFDDKRKALTYLR